MFFLLHRFSMRAQSFIAPSTLSSVDTWFPWLTQGKFAKHCQPTMLVENIN